MLACSARFKKRLLLRSILEKLNQAGDRSDDFAKTSINAGTSGV
jgi:hypothetical protein